MVDESRYPESDKVVAVRDTARAQGEFLDWLRDEKGFVLCRYLDGEDVPTPCTLDVNGLLYEYHGIDPHKVEAEHRAMLDSIREAEEEAAEDSASTES